MTNLEWIKKGKTGCNFATFFARVPNMVGWEIMTPKEWLKRKAKNKLPLIVSIEFGKSSVNEVRSWALLNGFEIEKTSENTEGLRIKCKQGYAWVQYFGPDSHVKTRQSPSSMLMYTNKLNKSYYFKVGWNGILHLAHAWYLPLSKNEMSSEIMWKQSYIRTRKIIGHDLTIDEAAKTTFKI